MEVKIQAIHFDATEKLQEFIEKKVAKFGKFSEEIRKVEVSLFRCTSALLMKRQHDVPVHGTPAAKFDSFQLCFLSALIRAF